MAGFISHEEFLIAADLLESNSDSFRESAKCLRDAALFEATTGSSFVVEGNVPPLLVEASRLFAKKITLAKFTQVVFSVSRDHATRSFAFTLLAGSHWTKGLIDWIEIERVERNGPIYSGVIYRFFQLIAGLKLQERLLELVDENGM